MIGDVLENETKFKCPAEKCQTEELSVRDFYLGKCCEDGNKQAVTGIDLQVDDL